MSSAQKPATLLNATVFPSGENVGSSSPDTRWRECNFPLLAGPEVVEVNCEYSWGFGGPIRKRQQIAIR